MNTDYTRKYIKYFTVYVLSVFFLSLFQVIFRTDAAGYTIFVIFLIIPMIGGVCAYKIGAYPGIIKWFAPAVFGVLNLIPGKVAFNTVGTIDFLFAFGFSAVGLVIRVLIQWRKRKKLQEER